MPPICKERTPSLGTPDVHAPPSASHALRVARTRLGLSQERMAQRLDVSLRQYQRWESGTTQPRPREWVRVRALLDGTEQGLEDQVVALQAEVERLRGELIRLQGLLLPIERVA